MPKKILISGGAGFVGRNLCRTLLRENPAPEITIIDDLSTGRSPESWELWPAEVHSDLGWGRRSTLPDAPQAPFTFAQANFAAVLAGELGIAAKTAVPELPVF